MCPFTCVQMMFFLIKQVPFVKVWILLMKVYNISFPSDLGLPPPRAAGRRGTQVRGDLYKCGARQGDHSSTKWKYQIGKKFLIQTSLQIEGKYPRNNFIPGSFLTNPFQIPLRHDEIGNLVCLFFLDFLIFGQFQSFSREKIMRANAFYKTRIGLPPTYSLRKIFFEDGTQKLCQYGRISQNGSKFS